MLIKETLNQATRILKKSKINSASLDAEILLSFAIRQSKEFIFAHPETNLTKKQSQKFQKLIAKRSINYPVAYLTGKKDFYGLAFKVNKNVLIPARKPKNWWKKRLVLLKKRD